MSFEASGRIVEIFDTQRISDKFQKREFVLEMKETSNSGFEFVEMVKFQTVQDKCSLLDSFNVGDMVKVSFNLRGRRWEKDGRVSYFTNLDAWRIENVQSTNEPSTTDPVQDQSMPPGTDSFPTEEPPSSDPGFDDLPF